MARQSSTTYVVVFAVGLAVVSIAAVGAFWQVTGSEVRRSASEAEIRRRPEPPAVVVDAAPEWVPTPEEAMRDTVFTLRADGRLLDALNVLERWLEEHPDDRPRRIDAARLAFEAERRERGVTHYRIYLLGGRDREVLVEVVARIVAEFEPPRARQSLTTLLPVDDVASLVRYELARLTAESGEPALAESILRPIQPFAIPRVDTLRHVVRGLLDPDIPTARQWAAEYPDEPRYHLVLARALRRGDRPGEALAHYVASFALDTGVALIEETADAAVAADSLALASRLLSDVLARDPARDGALLAYARVRARLGDAVGAVAAFEALMARDPDEARFAEARGVLFEVDDVRLTLPLLRRLVAFRPHDDFLRLRYAEDLERTEALPEAEAQYDTLLQRVPSAPLVLRRARVRAARGDLAGALADAGEAERQQPSVDAALMQADIHRWRNEREPARLAYHRAAALAPGDPRVAEGLRLLAVQRHDVLATFPQFGWQVISRGLGDAEGFGSAVVRVQGGGAPWTGEAVLTAAGEVRQVAGGPVPLVGVGADVGLSKVNEHLALSARVGALAFDGGAPIPTVHLEAASRTPTRQLRATLTHEPAYESLRAANVATRSDVLGATTLLASVGTSLSPRLDVYAQADLTRFGDANARGTAVATARWAIRGPYAVVYAASVATFTDATAAYWSPSLFATQGVGLDARTNRREGWSYGARFAPAYAWVRESAPGTPVGTQAALQATLAADATWRRGPWEVELSGGYGQDRAGAYSAGFGGLRARVVP